MQCFYKTIEARPWDPTAPVKPNDIYDLRAAATQKSEFRHTSMGAVNSLQAIRKLGITLLQKHFSVYITHMARNTLSRNIGYTQTFLILFEQE